MYQRTVSAESKCDFWGYSRMGAGGSSLPNMLIHAYGLFWRSDEIVWWPGSGTRNGFQLLGRFGQAPPKLQVADFRKQHGIYVMYNDWGSYYVGLALTGTIGGRLRIHHKDKHRDKWDRFSWFGFDQVLPRKNQDGLQNLKRMPLRQQVEPGRIIRDLEAMLIHVMPTVNRRNETFNQALEWKQVKLDERNRYMRRATSGTGQAALWSD